MTAILGSVYVIIKLLTYEMFMGFCDDSTVETKFFYKTTKDFPQLPVPPGTNFGEGIGLNKLPLGLWL
jgi:hypothetical protein